LVTKKENWDEQFSFFCGAGGNRTRVQTSVEKAFYMLIPLLFVGDDQEADKPNHHLAGWS
jgi:hypothetical protein